MPAAAFAVFVNQRFAAVTCPAHKVPVETMGCPLPTFDPTGSDGDTRSHERISLPQLEPRLTPKRSCLNQAVLC